MSLLKRVLSSVGIGAAKVDTVLINERFRPGDLLEGTVYINGGDVEQQIDAIYFSVHTTYEVETDDGTTTRTATLAKHQLSDNLTVEPGQQYELPLSFQLPWHTPLTVARTQVWLQTGLDIKQAIDPGDKDIIDVVPDDRIVALFDALQSLGFTLYQSDCEQAPARWRRRQPFVQEFEFKPTQGRFRGVLDELELICFTDQHQVEIWLEVDRKARGLGSLLSEMMELDESLVQMTYTDADPDALRDRLEQLIADHC